MCGISGIFGIERLEDAEKRVASMTSALAHRGPNADGVFKGGNVVLGHKRLSIIDIGQAANQPFTDVSGRYTLVFNGEIYNFESLRAELNYPFLTASDSEVLLAAYIKWKEGCLGRLNGMFAFAVWDQQQQELFIARDRMGIKPLYYAQHEGSFIFASEIRSILASGLVKREINPDSLLDYLRYQTVHTPYTILNGVFVLPAGHYMKFTDDEVQTERYWDPAQTVVTGLGKLPYEEVTRHIGKKLKDAVQSRLVSDVPFGAFLSGGIDSSAIVGLMSQASNQAVSTFNVTFGDDKMSESRYARQIAEKFGTRHTEIELNPKEFLLSLPDALAAMDHPSGDGPNTFVVSKATKEAGITMALSGLGGDELFAGYDFFQRSYTLKDKKWMLSFPKWVRGLGGTALQNYKPGVASEKIKQAMMLDYFDVEYIYQINRQLSPDRVNFSMLNGSFSKTNRVFDITREAMKYGTPGFNLPWFSKVSYAEMLTNLQSVLLRDTDQMSMAHALEVRVPFLDHHLVEFVLGVSDNDKFPHSPKKLLTDSLPGLLPEEIVNRPKMGFTFPWDKWLRNELKDFCEEKIEQLSKRPYFNQRVTRNRWALFLKGDPSVSWSRIWYLVVLEDWLQRHGVE